MSEADSALILPYLSAGPYRFGASPSDCAAIVGPPEQVREKRALGRLLEKRGLIEAVYEGEVLVQVELREGVPVELEGLDLFGDPKALAKLRAAHSDATELKQFINFPALGVCLGGFGKRKLPEGRLVFAYARSKAHYMTLLGSV
jgi:hypothetical protein